MVFALATILVVSAVVFMIFAILPFDPAALTCGQRCNEQIIEANRIRLGLDKPLYEQYFLFITGIPGNFSGGRNVKAIGYQKTKVADDNS
mgnify:CR=1 FL=1